MFELNSKFSPSGDQPEAIKSLVKAISENERNQVLLGVTGSGKTFTIANVIQQTQRPALILSHNKTLVAQLYGEFKHFFPNNAVEYFVSYYDYYQPEAYIANTDTYIEKDLSINDEIEKLRLSTTSSLLSGRRDIIVVASVSCIYGMGNPTEYKNGILRLKKGDIISRQQFLHKLVDILYSRTEAQFNRSNFRVRGDTVDVFVPYGDYAYRITFWGDEIEDLESFNPETGSTIGKLENIAIFPANMYVTPKDQMLKVIHEIQDELNLQIDYFNSIGKYIEATRLRERVNFDLEMIRELGYCSGIENYSRFLDRRKPGTRPFCLLDYFPDDYLMIIDESHVTVPQVGGMYGGDRSRKTSLVEYGFRLPSALDNRPLNFQEFQNLLGQTIYVSATPGDYEMELCGGVFVEQVVRPTGLLDPPIEVRPSENQIDDIIDEIQKTIIRNERVLITTLTKRMAEELTRYLFRAGINCRYIHSEVDTLDRVEIIRDLRLGAFDVLIGVNLLREGLDLPEVSLVCILDADKEGFLRNTRSLIQVSGRAARNSNGRVIFYADKMTNSMRQTIEETNRRREKQMKYNAEHGITPMTVAKTKEEIMGQSSVLDYKKEADEDKDADILEIIGVAEDPIIQYMNKAQLDKAIDNTKSKMLKAARETDYLEAARLRDEMYSLQKLRLEKFGE